MTDTDPNVVLHLEAIGSEPIYAGFWLRLVAFIMDFFVAGAVAIPIALIGAVPLIFFSAAAESDPNEVMKVMSTAYTAVYVFAIFSASWFYFIVFECSKLQATPGKLVLGLRVTDEHGQRITFLRSVSRTLGKILSAVPLCIGFVLAGLTPRKQSLHDLIAGCMVVRAQSQLGSNATSATTVAADSGSDSTADSSKSAPDSDRLQAQTELENQHTAHCDNAETAPQSGDSQSDQLHECDSTGERIIASAPDKLASSEELAS